MASTSEHRFVQRLREKSPEAFEELITRYARRLYSVAFRVLRSPADAEDAVQETFLKTFQQIDAFREESSLYTWLYRIVTNVSLGKVRHDSLLRVVPIEPYLPRFEGGQHAEKILDWSRLPDSVLSSQELSDYFGKCIDELPEEFRIAYILKDVEKLPEEQVCKILGVANSTMKNRVHRARLVIRKRIEKHIFS